MGRDYAPETPKGRPGGCKKGVWVDAMTRPPRGGRGIVSLRRAINAAIAAAPIETWEVAEARLVLAALEQIVTDRETNIVVFHPGGSSPRAAATSKGVVSGDEYGTQRTGQPAA